MKKDLRKFLARTVLSNEDKSSVQNALRALRRSLSSVDSDVLKGEKFRLALLGSHAEGLAFSGGDVDITILFPASSLPEDGPPLRAFRQNLVRSLRSSISSLVSDGNELKVRDAVFHSRAPILQLEHQNVKIDLTIENRMPVLKAALIRKLCGERYKPFLRLVKLWAGSRSVYGQRAGYPSGFAYGTLALFYLQLRGLVPALSSTKFVSNGDDNALTESEIVDLLAGFFSYYATQHDWVRGMVSLQHGHVCRRPTPASLDQDELDRVMKLYIVDPLEGPFVDLAGPYLTLNRQEKLKGEFKRAHQLLSTSMDVNELFENVNV